MVNVDIIPVNIRGQLGYDVLVYNEQATVQDYIDALDSFIEHSGCHRTRNAAADSCYGCNICCQERIPLTLVDALTVSDNNINKCFREIVYVYVEGRVVDITMGLDEQGRCIFLDKERGTCSNYLKRPLVCHTFVCCPSTRTAKDLREEIVNSGEDELVRSWFKIKGTDGRLVIHEGISPNPDARDYPGTPFSGSDDYRQVRLKDVCSPALWKRLYKP